MTCDVSKRLGGYLLSVLDDQKELIAHDWDVVNQVVGFEGDGKTTFVKLASLYQDPTITAAQWAYNAEQFEQIVDREDLPRGSCIVWDESDDLSSKWTENIIQSLKRKFKRIRKKGYIIWLVTPTFFDLNKYWALFRTRCLFDVYADPKRNDKGNFEANRGRVRFFNRDKKRQLYISGYKNWDMRCVMPNFIESFSKVPADYPINETELEEKKDEAMKNIIQATTRGRVSVAAMSFDTYLKIQAKLLLKPIHSWTNVDWADILGMDTKTFYTHRKKNSNNMPFNGDILAKQASGRVNNYERLSESTPDNSESEVLF